MDNLAAEGAANRTTATTNSRAAAAVVKTREMYLQLTGEEHARYYSAAALLSSAPYAVIVPLREGYLKLVCCQ